MRGRFQVYGDSPYLYFMTSTILEWIPVFLSTRYFDIVVSALRHCRNEKGLRVHGYVIMPNHFHLIGSCDPPGHLSGVMRDLKRHTSKSITGMLIDDGSSFLSHVLRLAASRLTRDSSPRIWQDGFHPVAVYSEKFFRQKLDYIHNNPVRKGYVRRPEDWLYSSAYDYATGNVGMLELDMIPLYAR